MLAERVELSERDYPLRSISALPQLLHGIVDRSIACGIRLLHLLATQTSGLLVLTLLVMLFHPPDVNVLPLDRMLFVVLVFAVGLRIALSRERVHPLTAITLPMLTLTSLAFTYVISQPYSSENWSVFAAKWLVPFVLFHISGIVFQDDKELRHFEIFSLIVLGYLILIAVAFWLGATGFILPRYIVDESLGIHADRARGPFLQAVPNGLSLNLLGLMALNSFRRGKLRNLGATIIFLLLPLAILATSTRAVWISFSASLLMLLFTSGERRLRRLSALLVGIGLVGVVFLASKDGLRERLQDAGPVEYRMAVYEAGLDMVQEKPFLGWGPESVHAELARRVSGFQVQDFYFHNTYLEILVERGLIGLGLYLWMLLGLLRLSRRASLPQPGSFLDDKFLRIWPVMVLAYAINACFVGMNYQFVNGYLFTIAGMLGARADRDSRSVAHCSDVFLA